MVEAGHGRDGRVARHAAGRRRDQRRVRDRVQRRRLHHQPAAGGSDRRPRLDCVFLRRRAAAPGARRAGPAAGAAPLLLEERQVGARAGAAAGGRARLLGGLRLPQLRGAVARAALRRRLNWQPGTVLELIEQTARTKSIVFDVPGWSRHRAGQHVDVRLTAEDGYQAQRRYSIASAPGALDITVVEVSDGEVSPWMVSVAR